MRFLATIGSIYAAMLLTAGMAGATTYHTIPQGIGFQFVSDEAFLTSTLARTAHFTWDADWLYVGNLGKPTFPALPQRRIAWYFDTDPRPVPWSGSGTATAIPYGTQTWALPFFADHALILFPGGGFDFRSWNGTAWVSVATTVWYTQSNLAYHKAGIPRTFLGSPTAIYAVGFSFSEETGAETTYASWPNDSLEGGDGYKPFGIFRQWFGFPLGGGLSPNHPSFHSQTLPVELMGFSVE